MYTISTLFSGFGGVDIGAMAAGVTPIWAVEHDADIAAVYRQNVGDHVRVGNILDMNPADFETPCGLQLMSQKENEVTMKPKNFPERKRQRQLGALARLLSAKNQDGRAYEITVLEERTADNMRGVSTKKARGARGARGAK